MIWATCIWALIVFFLGWEMLALATKEKYFPTWSRMIWGVQDKWPWSRWLVLAVTLLIGLGTTTWLVIHFFFGECAFGIC